MLHQPRNERIDLLGGHRAGAEDQRIAFLAFVLLGVDVEPPALHDGGAFDGLPRGAVDATEDHLHLVLRHKLGRLGFRDGVGRCAVLEIELDLPPQQAAVGVDLVNHHPCHVGVGAAHERKCSRFFRDHADFDGRFCHGSCLS